MNIHLPDSIQFCLQQLECSGFEAWVVGGCVRDSLLNATPNDWDLCTSAQPQQVAACFYGNKVIPTGEKHGTVTVLVNHIPVEITTFRHDGNYVDHRRPDMVTFTTSLEQDLARRDFTVNAMAYNPSRGLADPFGGQIDLERGIMRCVGNAQTRFEEDALRILRLFRFACRLDFHIDFDALHAATNCRQYLQYISPERIQSELNKLLLGPQPGSFLAQMSAAGVLAEFIPEFSACIGFVQNTPYHDRTVDQHIFDAIDASPPILSVRLGLLLHDIAKPSSYTQDEAGTGHFYGHEKRGAEMAYKILKRLRYDNATLERCVNLIALHDRPIPREETKLKKLLYKLGAEQLQQLLLLRIADTSAKNIRKAAPRLEALLTAQQSLDSLLARGAVFGLEQLAVSGQDLLSLGFPQGKQLGETLHRLLELVMEDESRNTAAWLLDEATRILSEI